MVHPDNRVQLSTPIYQQQRKSKTTLNIIALDTSGSTLAKQQLSDAKAIVQSLCEYFYQQRQKITLLTFGNQNCQWLISDSKVPIDMTPTLSAIKAGGGTPLRQALLEIDAYIIKRKQSAPHEKQKIFLITDGRSRDKVDDICLVDNAEIYVLDSENSDIKLNKAQQLAKLLKANFLS